MHNSEDYDSSGDDENQAGGGDCGSYIMW